MPTCWHPADTSRTPVSIRRPSGTCSSCERRLRESGADIRRRRKNTTIPFITKERYPCLRKGSSASSAPIPTVSLCRHLSKEAVNGACRENCSCCGQFVGTGGVGSRTGVCRGNYSGGCEI